MKLKELVSNKKKGLYVGMRVLEPSCSQIKEHCRSAGIPIAESAGERRLHTTVLYSRKPCPNFVAEQAIVHGAEFICYELFNKRHDSNQKVLVIKLNAPTIVARHLTLMAEHNATFDFPVFTPHITIADGYSGDINSLPTINFPITLGLEYSEELDDK